MRAAAVLSCRAPSARRGTARDLSPWSCWFTAQARRIATRRLERQQAVPRHRAWTRGARHRHVPLREAYQTVSRYFQGRPRDARSRNHRRCRRRASVRRLSKRPRSVARIFGGTLSRRTDGGLDRGACFGQSGRHLVSVAWAAVGLRGGRATGTRGQARGKISGRMIPQLKQIREMFAKLRSPDTPDTEIPGGRACRILARVPHAEAARRAARPPHPRAGAARQRRGSTVPATDYDILMKTLEGKTGVAGGRTFISRIFLGVTREVPRRDCRLDSGPQVIQ